MQLAQAAPEVSSASKLLRPAETCAAPARINDVLGSPGQPLGEDVRSHIEPRFNFSFDDVRIHSDAAAANSASALNAAAFTVGNQIVFGRDRYQPTTRDGFGLLAHELTHVVQQTGSFNTGTLEVEEENSPAEQQADRVSSRLVGGSEIDASSIQKGRAQRIARDRLPDSDSGVAKNFPPPGPLTYDELLKGIFAIIRAFETAASSSEAMTSLEEKTLPAYVNAFLRVAKAEGRSTTIFGLKPDNPVHQKVLRLLPAQPSQQNFLAPPAPIPPAAPKQAAPKSQDLFDDFLRKHAKEIDQLPNWTRNFAKGFNGTPVAQKFLAAAAELNKTSLDSKKTPYFYYGFLVGIPVGAYEDVADQVKAFAELIVKLSLLRDKTEADPKQALADLHKFFVGLPDQLMSYIDAENLGALIGNAIVDDLDKELLNKDPKAQGEYFGKIVGKILMETALLLVGVEEAMAAVKGIRVGFQSLKNSSLFVRLGEALSSSSKPLRAAIEAKGLLKEVKAASLLKEAKGAASGTKALGEAATKESADAAKAGSALKPESPPPATTTAPPNKAPPAQPPPTPAPDAAQPKVTTNERKPRGFTTDRATPGRNIKPGTLEDLESTQLDGANKPRGKAPTRQDQLEGLDLTKAKASDGARKEFDKLRDVYAEKLHVGPGGEVHHARELTILDRYPGVYTQEELNAFKNMRGVPAQHKSVLHQGVLRQEWNKVYEELDAFIADKALTKGTPEYNKAVRDYIEHKVFALDEKYDQYMTHFGKVLK